MMYKWEVEKENEVFLSQPIDGIWHNWTYKETMSEVRKMASYIKSLNLPNLMMASPDMGGTKRANAYAKHLDCGVVVCYKQRKKANIISDMFLIGEVKGKDVIIVDDMVDTAGTLTKAADLMMENGASSVRAMTTHAILSGEAYERIEKSKLTELIVTDTIPLSKQSNKIKVLSVADLFADIMKKVTRHESISESFIV